MGWIKEGKQCSQKYYGLYCNNVRKENRKPLSYDEWKDKGCPKK